jgi:phosphoribosylanthranilate isomerase
MNRIAVKICGITSLEDGLAALHGGADLLGFNFYPPSPRCLPPEACAQIVSGLRASGYPFLAVGVFVNLPPDPIERLLERCRLDLAQLSGDEPPQTLAALGERAFKALRAPGAAELQRDLDSYPARTSAPAYLVDAYRPGKFGGTGQLADWCLAATLARRHPVLLAGGLTPENVTAAIRQVHPWGVDVASGVESAPGRKDQAKMTAFILACRQAADHPASSSIAE